MVFGFSYLCVFLPATVVKRCGRNLSQSAHDKNISRAPGQKFFLFFSLFSVDVRSHLEREVGQRVREGGREGDGVLSLSLSALILILLFQSRGRVCSVGRCVWQH